MKNTMGIGASGEVEIKLQTFSTPFSEGEGEPYNELCLTRYLGFIKPTVLTVQKEATALNLRLQNAQQ